MSINAGKAIAYLELDSSKFTAGLKTAQESLKNVSSETTSFSQKMTSMGSGLKQVGSTLSLVSVPLIGVGAAAVKTAANFEAGMSEVKAITGATGSEFEALEKQAKELGRTTKFSATEAAEGMKYFGMAGYDTDKILAAMPNTLNLAAASGTDLGITCDIVSDAMSGLKMSTEETGRFTDVMAATVTGANTSVALMGETLKYVSPVAGTLGISMEDLSLAIGIMGNNGIKGSQAGTALKAGLVNLVKPTDTMYAAMKKYGISLKENEDGSVNLRETMENLREKMSGLSETEQAAALAAIFGKEAMAAWSAIVNASEEDFYKLAESIDNSNGMAAEMAEIMQDNLQGALTELGSAFEGVLITIGDALIPIMKEVVQKLNDWCTWFNTLDKDTQLLIITIGGFVAALGPALMIIGSLIGAVGNIVGAFGLLSGAAIPLVILALAGIVAAIGENETALLGLQEKWGDFGLVMSALCEFISGLWDLTITGIMNALTFLVEAMAALLDGPGGKTVSDAWERYTAKQELTVQEGMSKILLTTSRGLMNLRNMTDGELEELVNIYENAMKQVPLIAEEKYDEAAKNIAETLTGMNSYQLDTLSSMNDTTRYLFGNIREGMTVEEIIPILVNSFETMQKAGKLNVEDLGKAMTSGMETIRNQMTTKTEEGASNVDSNMQQAKDSVENATDEIANVVAENMETAAKNMDDTTGEMPKTVEGNMNKVVESINKAMDNVKTDTSTSLNSLKDELNSAVNNMNNKLGELGQAAYNAKAKIYDFAAGAMSYVSTMARNVINDWNNVVNSLSRSVTGTVTINRIINESERGVQTIADNEGIEAYVNTANNSYLDVENLNRMAKSGNIAISNLLDNAFSKAAKRKEDKKKEDNSTIVNLNLNIEKVENSNERSIEDLADELAFYLKRKNIGLGRI
jgi:TP901 family phage tail tape measure protein